MVQLLIIIIEGRKMNLTKSQLILEIQKLEDKLTNVHSQKHLIEMELQNLDHKLKQLNEADDVPRTRNIVMPRFKRMG